jgi:hypothetical protein
MQDHLRRRRRRRRRRGEEGMRRRKRRRKRRRRRRSGGRAYSEQTKFFDALQGLEAARRYIQQFNVEDDILVTCSKFENKL